MCREGAGFVAACGGENIFSLKTGFERGFAPCHRALAALAHSQGEKYFLRRTGRHKK